jgi:hypothetical protein
MPYRTLFYTAYYETNELDFACWILETGSFAGSKQRKKSRSEPIEVRAG